MIRAVEYRHHSLEDFLISTTLTIDGQLDDGWGASYPVKGREIEATILFADISGFSRRTLDLSPAETLIFVNNFFAWISAEALRSSKGIVDKYIGDEIMVVFSKDFGSEDAFVDAIQAARWMAENDAWGFCPHIGITSGPVIVGYVGTPIKYNCSVFGAPVARAARCAGVRPEPAGKELISTSIVVPAQEWEGRDFDTLFPPEKFINLDGSTYEHPHSWILRPERSVPVKNIPIISVREIVKTSTYFPSQSPEDRAKEGLRILRPPFHIDTPSWVARIKLKERDHFLKPRAVLKCAKPPTSLGGFLYFPCHRSVGVYATMQVESRRRIVCPHSTRCPCKKPC